MLNYEKVQGRHTSTGSVFFRLQLPSDRIQSLGELHHS